MKNYRIHLLRHGKTLANEQGRFVGRTDVPLSEDGIAQLRDLSRNYEYPGVQKVYSSPLMRCVQTAEILYPAFEPVTIEGLREYDFGKYENKTAALDHPVHSFQRAEVLTEQDLNAKLPCYAKRISRPAALYKSAADLREIFSIHRLTSR